jgi:hypothetical protein
MNVDKRAHLARRVSREIFAQCVKLLMHELLGRAETLDLPLDLGRFDQIVVDVECSRGDQIGPPDGNTA